MGRLDSQQLYTFTAAGIDCIGLVKALDIEVMAANANGAPITADGEVPVFLGAEATIKTTLMATYSGQQPLTNLNMSAFSIDSNSYVGELVGGTFSGSIGIESFRPVGSIWTDRYGKRNTRTFTMDAELQIVDSTSGAAFVFRTDVFESSSVSNAVSARNMIVTFTINAVAYTWPAYIEKAQHLWTEGGLQSYRVTLKGKAPTPNPASPTAYPTAPTGTTTLLEKAINVPGTAIALVIMDSVDSTAYETKYAGNAVFQDFSMKFGTNQIFTVDYTWLSHGAWTAAAGP